MVAELLAKERNLLPVADKIAAGARRAVRRVIISVKQRKKIEGNKQAAYAREYAVQWEDELQKVYDGILTLMDENLISLESAKESMVFYCKVNGYFYRYLEESATGDAESSAAVDSGVAHTGATKIAEKDPVVTHPSHLDPALNLTVFQFERRARWSVLLSKRCKRR